jgi:hypothetical protein
MLAFTQVDSIFMVLMPVGMNVVSEGLLSVLFRRLSIENKHLNFNTVKGVSHINITHLIPLLSPARTVIAEMFEFNLCFYVHGTPQDVKYHVLFTIGNSTLHSNAVST